MIFDKKSKKILVVAAHPDDELLGCGGSLIKLRKQGFNIKCIFIADGESSREMKKKIILKNILQREMQAKKVSKILKFQRPEFSKLPDNKLDSVPILKIVKIIENHIKKFKPSIIFTHSLADLNVDHSKICKAVTTATRPFSKTFIKTILSFEVPSNSEISFSQNKKVFIPNFYIDISKEIKLKLKTIKIYKNELRKFPHPRSIKGIKSLAIYRGSQSGMKFAESFHILRGVN